MLAEQNTDIIEEVINLKNNMKAIIGQLIDDFEEGMQELKDDNKKYFNDQPKLWQEFMRK